MHFEISFNRLWNTSGLGMRSMRHLRWLWELGYLLTLVSLWDFPTHTTWVLCHLCCTCVPEQIITRYWNISALKTFVSSVKTLMPCRYCSILTNWVFRCRYPTSPPGGGKGLLFKRGGCARRTFWKDPLRGTKNLFRAWLEYFFHPKDVPNLKQQINWRFDYFYGDKEDCFEYLLLVKLIDKPLRSYLFGSVL